ncbi:MAG: DUF3520 domain-containing protein [Prosthecobacter sp.]|nr:DUF3520 domain-containing protein [Prosthecobacter sp.]
MNTPPNDSPELTAYALGELSAPQAADVHALLATLPAALSELEQVEALTDALRQGAPIPQQRLSPDQRHAVLHPAHVPRLVVPMQPRQIQRRRPAVFWPAFRGFAKAAAIIALTGVAFMLGRGLPSGQTQVAATRATTPEMPLPAPAPAVKPAPAAPQLAATKPAPSPVSLPAPAKPEVAVIRTPAPPTVAATTPAPVAPQAVKTTIASAPTPAPAPVAKPALVVAIGFTTPPSSDAFVSTSRRPNDQFGLRPAQIRPLPAKDGKSELFASPAPVKPAADPKAGAKARPDLYIHSWKADVTTCPWNEANRLLRVAVQLPADQPAALSPGNSFPLQITFDPNNVREYRMLCERRQPAAELRSAGTHVIWYEYLPNGATDSARLIATVTLPGARFTTQAVDPFDGSKLRVLDRGQSWQAAREDFVFESSVVGFGMLLRGAPQTGQLNHQLVLNLASKAKGTDATGERTRFIRLVQEARQAAGL